MRYNMSIFLFLLPVIGRTYGCATSMLRQESAGAERILQLDYILERQQRSCRGALGAKHLPLSAAVIRKRLKQIPIHTS